MLLKAADKTVHIYGEPSFKKEGGIFHAVTP